jgi:hypothetical protein
MTDAALVAPTRVEAREGRERALLQVLGNIAELTTQGKQARWADILKNVYLNGHLVTYTMIRNWIREPWGRKIWESFNHDFTEITQEMILMKYGQALSAQLDIAGDKMAKGNTSAFRAVTQVALQLGMLKVEEKQTTTPRSMTIILQQYGGTVAIGNQSPQIVKELMRGEDDVVDGEVLNAASAGEIPPPDL